MMRFMSPYVREEEFDYGKEVDTVCVSGLVNLGDTVVNQFRSRLQSNFSFSFRSRKWFLIE